MGRTAIWVIIALMSIALVGSVLIQIYWFRSAITLQEQRFDTDVYDALNAVQQRLIQEEEKRLSSYEIIGTMNAPGELKGAESGWVKQELAEFLSESQLVRQKTISNLQSIADTLYKEEEFVSLLEPQDEWRRTRMQIEMTDSRARMRDLESRIDPRALTDLLIHELANQGIDLDCEYGVFSNKGQGFVILNGMYVVEEDATESSSANVTNDERSLLTSKYRVDLFTKDLTEPPGILKVHFPNKSTWLWKSLIPTLLGTILFTGLILFCFGYTIWVILRQKKVSEMKTDFINNMTHEFKTPIATISLATDSIVSPMVIDSKDKIKRFTDIIRQENKRMLGQVEKVLQMAQIDKSDFELKVSEVDMHQIIEQAVSNSNLQVQKRGGNITKELMAGKPTIYGDQTHLANVIYNLLDNANKYSTESPEILVKTRNVSGGVEVIVEDHGIGMTKEDRKQIFEKFYRVHTGNLHDVKGFGLGLSYVKAITDAHDGKIDVKSELGEGSSFILYFPHKGPKHRAA